jgi:carboxylesterase
MGLSAGAALALRLAEQRPADVAGLVLVNPCVRLSDRRLALLPLAKWVVPSFPGVVSDIKRTDITEVGYARVPSRALASALAFWSAVRADLGKVTAPVLVYRSRDDHVVPEASTRAVLAGVASRLVEERVVEDSYHVATLDNDAESIFAGSLGFVHAHARSAAEG